MASKQMSDYFLFMLTNIPILPDNMKGVKMAEYLQVSKIILNPFSVFARIREVRHRL